MKFVSVIGTSPPVSLRDAVFQGIAPDGSLYIPQTIPALSSSFLSNVQKLSLEEIGLEVCSQYVEDVPKNELRQIVERALNFPIPLVRLEEDLFLLELFHGPTLAFKDVGARFMAELLSFYMQKEKRSVTILVATSGDTGSAVAHGFFNIPHINVCILYPSGKISRLQEQQMTTLGGNIHAVEVEGTFDDCQRLLKMTLADNEAVKTKNLTTANSINLGRLIPQIVYYVWAYGQWKKENADSAPEPTVIVPSGNFGNLTAGIYARRMGIPFSHFIAATNANDVVSEYFRSGIYAPRPSLQTFSNAMDVGNPSNLARLQKLYGNDIHSMKKDISAISVSDNETLAEIRSTYEHSKYILDPHTAVGVYAAHKAIQDNKNAPMIVAATAHPAKFPEIIKQAINLDIFLPRSLKEAMDKKKKSVRITADYKEWKEVLLNL